MIELGPYKFPEGIIGDYINSTLEPVVRSAGMHLATNNGRLKILDRYTLERVGAVNVEPGSRTFSVEWSGPEERADDLADALRKRYQMA